MTLSVLVTGASGFLAQHVVLQLLEKGYTVRGTARSRNKAEAAMAVIRRHAGSAATVDFAICDLTSDAGWEEAATGCRFVVHTASPIPADLPKDEDELIVPARDGALRVLAAAAKAGVERVVMTSSVAAVMYGNKSFGSPLDERSWTDLSDERDTTSYIKSKTVAEQAAWSFVKEQAPSMELATIQPSLILGPALSADASASLEFVTQPLNGKLPAIPKIGYEIVDVRDVAALHILAMERSEAKGERFIATESRLSFKDVCDLLKQEMPNEARRVPKRSLPNMLLRLLARINPPLKQVALETGVERRVSSGKARHLLGWAPRPAREAVLAAARSAVEHALVKV